MTGLRTVSFEALMECIDLASGNPATFRSLMLERNSGAEVIAVTDKGKPSFLIQLSTYDTSNWVDDYAAEVERMM